MEILFTNGTGCQIGIAKTPAEVTAFVATLEEIAFNLGWQPGDQIRDQADAALCLAAIVEDNLAGGLQLVRPDGDGRLPCHSVWPETDLGNCRDAAHIIILALKSQYRGRSGLFWPLCMEMWRYCVTHRISSISLEVTPDLLRLYRRLGWPLEIIGDLRQHWGEDYCYLCRMGTAEVAGAMLMKAPRSDLYRGIVGLMSQPL